MAGTRFYLRQSRKDEAKSNIWAILHAKGERVYWSLGIIIENKYWDDEQQRLKSPDNSESLFDYAFINSTLKAIDETFLNLYYEEKFSKIEPNLNRIRKNLKFHFVHSIHNRRWVNEIITRKKDIEEINKNYTTMLLRAEGWPITEMGNIDTLHKLKKLIVRSKRELKKIQNDNKN